MKTTLRMLFLFVTIATIYSCKKNHSNPPSESLVDPADANALSQVLGMPTGTTRVNGTMPSPTSGVQTPVITTLISNVLTSNGATAPFLYTYSNAISNLGGFYVQVYGSGIYFNVPYTGGASSSGQINLPLVVPANVDSGNFCLMFSVYDLNGRVSNQTKVCASVIRLGTGALQVSLSWNTATDQDLWVTDPSGYKIYFNDKISTTGGRLDRDDINGYGPENIFWLANAPDGSYKVQVNDYRYTTSPNTCYVTVSVPGQSRSYTRTTQNNSTVTVVTITKRGTEYEFSN
jgi:hypothetical protein